MLIQVVKSKFWTKIKILVKYLKFTQKLIFLQNNANFGQKSTYGSKIEIFVLKCKFWSKILILVENRNFGGKIQISVENSNCRQKIPLRVVLSYTQKWSNFVPKICYLIFRHPRRPLGRSFRPFRFVSNSPKLHLFSPPNHPAVLHCPGGKPHLSKIYKIMKISHFLKSRNSPYTRLA